MFVVEFAVVFPGSIALALAIFFFMVFWHFANSEIVHYDQNPPANSIVGSIWNFIYIYVLNLIGYSCITLNIKCFARPKRAAQRAAKKWRVLYHIMRVVFFASLVGLFYFAPRPYSYVVLSFEVCLMAFMFWADCIWMQYFMLLLVLGPWTWFIGTIGLFYICSETIKRSWWRRGNTNRQQDQPDEIRMNQYLEPRINSPSLSKTDIDNIISSNRSNLSSLMKTHWSWLYQEDANTIKEWWICLAIFEKNQEVFQILWDKKDVPHVFHTLWIINWAKRERTCPIWRKDLFVKILTEAGLAEPSCPMHAWPIQPARGYSEPDFDQLDAENEYI